MVKPEIVFAIAEGPFQVQAFSNQTGQDACAEAMSFQAVLSSALYSHIRLLVRGNGSSRIRLKSLLLVRPTASFTLTYKLAPEPNTQQRHPGLRAGTHSA
jgi:hypothetical protein